MSLLGFYSGFISFTATNKLHPLVWKNSISVTVNILYWHLYRAFASLPSSILFKVYCSPEFVCGLLPMDALRWHYKQIPVPIMGTSCPVFFVGRASEPHSFHSIKKTRGRRHRWEWKIGVLFYLERKVGPAALLSLSLCLSLFCSWALCLEAKLKWVTSTPYCITPYNDCCSHSVVPNQSHWTFGSFWQGELRVTCCFPK